MSKLSICTLTILLSYSCAYAAEVGELEARGIAALKLSQTDSDAVVSAALYFGQAAESYEASGDQGKATEMNSFLYWCKKKMTLQQMDAFLKGDATATMTLTKRMKELETVAKPDEAQTYFDRAETYAAAHPKEHLLIAIRFYEIADRFKGTELSLQAQDRSLKEMTLEKTDSGTPAAKLDAAVSRPGVKKAVPTKAMQKEAEKTIQDLYKVEFLKTTIEDKAALAARLEKQADESLNDPASQYALITQAGILFAQAGDFQRLCGTFEKLNGAFEGDFKDYVKAQLGTIAVRTSNPKLGKVISAMRVLLDRPEDAAANLVVGKYKLSQGNAEHAEIHLDRSKNAALIALIKQERGSPVDSPAQITLGDAWWDAAEKAADRDDKELFRSRSMLWYEKALPNSTGLAKAKIEKRIADATPAASRAAKGIDILKLINPGKDAVRGEWKMANGALEYPGPGESAVLQLPMKPGPEYDLHVVFTATSSNPDPGIVLPCNNQQVYFGMAGWGNSKGGLRVINGAEENETTAANNIQMGVEYDVVAQVRKASVKVFWNRKELVDYRFTNPKFTLHEDWKTRDKKSIGLYIYHGTMRYKVIELSEPGAK